MMILFYKLRSIYHDFIHAGLKPSGSNDLARTRKIGFNQFLLLAFFSLLCIWACFLKLDLPSSPSYFLVSLVFLMLGRFFHLKGVELLARAIAVTALVLLPLLLSWRQGASSSTFLLLFPLALLIGHLFQQSNRWELGGYLVLLFFTFILTTKDVSLDKPNFPFLLLLTCFLLSLLIVFFTARWNSSHQAMLEEEKAMGDLLFNSSFDAVFVLKATTHTIKQCNNRAQQLLESGNDAETLQGRQLESILEHSYRQLVPWDQITGPTQASWQGELAFLTLEGNIFPAYASFVPFEYKKTAFVKLSVLDLSHLKNAEFELIRAREEAEMATHAKSRFLSHMSHEIRTPLTGVLETTRLLLQQKRTEEQEPHLQSLQLLSEQLLHQVNDVLDFNKMDAGKLELDLQPFDLTLFCKNLVKRFLPQATQKGLKLTANLVNGCNERFITGDVLRLNQVLGNLISNAIKFTGEGKVELKITLLEQDHEKLKILFQVEDTGKGIAPENLHKVFELFTQEETTTAGQYGGSGLGLALSSNLVASMGSQLNVKSELGKGSVFYFTLTTTFSDPTAKTELAKGKLNVEGKKVMLVDDHKVSRSVAERMLKQYGIETVVADSGASALEKLETVEVDLVLTDLEMPEMDGRELLIRLKAGAKNTKVIAFSASVNETTREELLNHGFDGVLCKPFSMQDLERCLEKSLNNMN